ncbi:MAG: Plug domain-containing protein [Sphingomonas sp.]
MPARAQDQGVEPAVQPAAAQADESEDEGLGTIVVTAQRRSEDVQRAAVSITAVAPLELQNGAVTEVASLTNLVPALQAVRQGYNTALFVRGIGTTQGNALSDPAIAFNLNGVYLARTGSVNGHFYDLERVEVLKGPQGTL